MVSDQIAVCPANEALVEHMRKWWTEMAENKPKNYTQNTEKTLQKAFSNVCHHKSPITTLKELKDVKGVGKWIVTEMRGFFNCDSGPSQDDDLAKKGKKTKGSKSYLPQKNSAAYALLITLHRETGNGTEYMRKQDLIDAAEASGLARVPIAPERGRGKPGAPGSSPREFYSGWSAMAKLIKESLVYKSSCPAKFMLSDKGHQVALECLSRSGMLDSAPNLVSSEETPDEQDDEVLELDSANSPTRSNLNTNKGTKDDIPADFLERFTLLGYTREQVVHALAEVSRCWSPEELSTLWPKVLCRLREIEVYDSHSDPQASLRRNSCDASTSCRYVEGHQTLTSDRNHNSHTSFRSDASLVATESPIIASSSFDYLAKKGHKSDPQASHDDIRLPPLENLEKFENVYEVVLILDDRENFVRTKTRNLREKICAEFKIPIEVDHLPVGDAIWIARHKQHGIKYVLDYIVERKNVDDLRGSIRDNRYKDQKMRLQRTGIKKIMYVVEGDPNSTEAADSIKTACFTTELLDGFDVQRTSNLSDTLRRYGYLTQAITDFYQLNSCPEKCKTAGTCFLYDEFIQKCKDLQKMTVSDVFAMQLMQVPQVTEEVAIAVLNCYPTLYSLACAYATLGDDTVAQEELLKTKSEGAVNAIASKNIFRFVWVS